MKDFTALLYLTSILLTVLIIGLIFIWIWVYRVFNKKVKSVEDEVKKLDGDTQTQLKKMVETLDKILLRLTNKP